MKQLQVGLFVDPPWVNENWESDNEPGIYVDVMKYFCTAFRVDCNLSLAPTVGYGHYENGSWHGMVKHISNYEFDLTVPGFTPNSNRFNVVDFSHMVFNIPMVFFTRNPGTSVLPMWNFLQFHWSVWFCIAIISLYIGVFLTFMETSSRRLRKFMAQSVVRCIGTFSIVTNQGMTKEAFKLSSRLMMAFWLLATIVLCGIYSARLLSSMISHPHNLPFTDFSTFIECIEDKRCQLATADKSMSYIQEIFQSEDQLVKRLRNALVDNPLIFVENKTDLLRSMLNEKSTYITWYINHAQYVSITGNNKACDFSRIFSGFTDDQSFMFSKNFSSKEKVNFEVSLANGLRIPSRIYKRYVGIEPDCEPKPIEGTKTLSVISIIGIMFVLFCGSLCAFVIFVCEIILTR